MRFPIRPASPLLAAIVLALGLAGAAHAEPAWHSYFNREYIENRDSWESLVPPPALKDLPPQPYYSGDTCKGAPRSKEVRRYCQLSVRCLAREPTGELREWCDVLGEVINNASSLRACNARSDSSTDEGCVSARRRIHPRCYGKTGALAAPLDYLCHSFFAAYPADRYTAPPAAPGSPNATSPPGGAPSPGGTPGPAGPTDITVPGDAGRGRSDVVRQNEGTSPSCREPRLEADARHNCDNAGSIFRPNPLNSYGLDNQADPGPLSWGESFMWAIQGLGVLVWEGLLLALNGVLLMLEWSFSLDLVGRAMHKLTISLNHLHNDILGESWFLLAISVAGLWGIWNGLVRLRTIQTLGSLGMTVLLICAALLLIHNPRDTVGRFSGLANESSLSALSAASEGTIEDPLSAYAKANQRLFDAMVLHPWCALQFEDVDFCLSRPGKICTNEDRRWLPDGDKCREHGDTVAAAWLEHPARSEERKQLYKQLKETNPERVRLQEADGTFERIGLLGLVAIGLLGAIALLLYLAIRLMLAAISTLILLLAAPFMLVVPAFGDAGRNAFVTWLKRLAGAIAAKLVYALFLAVVILIAGIIAGLDGIGWYPKWMLLILFWWGVLIKRNDIVGFVMPSSGRSGLGLMGAYFGYRAIKDIGRDTFRTATYLPRQTGRLGRRVGRAARNEAGLRRRARDEARKRDARRELEHRGRQALTAEKEAEASRARDVVAAANADRSRLGEVRSDVASAERSLSTVERDIELAGRERTRVQDEIDRTPKTDRSGQVNPRLAGLYARIDELDDRLPELRQRRRDLQSRVSSLRAERVRLEGELAKPEVARAESVVRRGPAGGEIKVTEGEIRDWVTARQRELGDQHPRHDDDVDARHRELIVRTDGEGLSRRARRAVRRELDFDPERADLIKGQAREIRGSLRREARLNRRRTGMFRR